MKALVTGASGLVGANIVRALLERSHEVRALVRPASDLRGLDGLPIEIAQGDVLEAPTLERAVRDCDVVFHAAAVYSYWGHSAETLQKVAVTGTENVLRAACGAGVRRVVLTSSSVVLGSSTRREVRDETSKFEDREAPAYVVSKVEQDAAAFDLARELKMDLVAVCPTVTVGPFDYRLSPSNAVVANYLNDPVRSTFPGGCNIASSRDVGAGHVLVAEKGSSGERYVLGSENYEWRQLHELISEICSTLGPHFTMNHTTSYLAAAAAEFAARWTGTRPAVSREEARMTGRYYWYSHARAARLGYAPRPARLALVESVAWLVTTPHISSYVVSTLQASPEIREAQRSFKAAVAS